MPKTFKKKVNRDNLLQFRILEVNGFEGVELFFVIIFPKSGINSQIGNMLLVLSHNLIVIKAYLEQYSGKFLNLTITRNITP